MAKPLRALIIEHERATPGGLIYEWLQRHDAEIDELQIDVDEREVDLSEYDLLVPLGSVHPPYADHIPWIPREVELLREAYAADVSVLGICFGGQLLARALGGRCYRTDVSEIGWLPVRSLEPELVPEGPWFQWHFDAFDPPPDARLVAESELSPQSYVIGRSLGLQFHPEVTPEIVEEWALIYRHELDAVGVDPDMLLEETKRRRESHQRNAETLLDAFLERVAQRENVSR